MLDSPKFKFYLFNVLGQCFHLVLLMLPTLILLPQSEFQSRSFVWSIVSFAGGLLIASLLESIAVAESNPVPTDSRDDHRQFLRIEDPLALRVASSVGLLLLLLFWAAQVEAFCSPFRLVSVQILGVVLLLTGIAMRVIAIRTLGPAFVSDIQCDGSVNRSGIYRWMAHPSEVGLLLIAVGAPLILFAPMVGVMAMFLLGPISVWRVKREDRLLKIKT